MRHRLPQFQCAQVGRIAAITVSDIGDCGAAIHRRLGCPVLDVTDFSVEETAMRVIKLVADRQRERRAATS